MTGCGLALATLAAGAQDTTFLDVADLAEQVIGNTVRVRALGNPEHGFGLVIGATGTLVYVATARHVVGSSPDERIEIEFCAPTVSQAGPLRAERLMPFDAGTADVTLLRARRPAGYIPGRRVLAAEVDLRPGHETRLLGQAQQCGLAPRSGALARLRDEQDNLRVEFPDAQGGSSGGPVLTGYGVPGLITDASDLTYTVYSARALAEQVNRQLPGVWQLEAARNIPPTDPHAAEVDLAETLNLYLFSVQNLRGLLLQPDIPRKLYFDHSNDYNRAVTRFRDAKSRYDGALKHSWPPDVLPMWVELRDRLWSVHQSFWKLNDGDSKLIFEQMKAPPAVTASMLALKPAMDQLESEIGKFLKVLSNGRTP